MSNVVKTHVRSCTNFQNVIYCFVIIPYRKLFSTSFLRVNVLEGTPIVLHSMELHVKLRTLISSFWSSLQSHAYASHHKATRKINKFIMGYAKIRWLEEKNLISKLSHTGMFPIPCSAIAIYTKHSFGLLNFSNYFSVLVYSDGYILSIVV